MKVLIVEDEHRIASYIKKGLALKSYVADVAYDGETGYDLANTEKYDVIILDRMLPKMDGLDICQQLRAEGNHTPILLLTAKTAVAEKVEGLEAGADDYLAKPFAFVELLARLKALARRPENSLNTKLTAGSLTLDTRGYEVTRAGKKLHLSKKEFALLEFLMRHPGQVFNKDQLAQQVWSYDSEVLPNIAQVYLGYLRTKIDRAFPKETPLVDTVRGFGYRIGKGK